MCSFDWLKRLACLPPTSPSQSTTMTTVPNTTSLTTTKPQLQVAAATTTHTPVNQGTAIQTPAKRRYSERTTSLSTFILDERENQIIYCLCGGLKNWGHTSVYKMWKQVPSITWMINSKGGKIFFENSTCCCRYFLAQRRHRGCHIFQIQILFKVLCLSANPFTGF